MAVLLKLRRPLAPLLAAVLAAVAGPARAEEFHLFPESPPAWHSFGDRDPEEPALHPVELEPAYRWNGDLPDFSIAVAAAPMTGDFQEPPSLSAPKPPAPPQRLFTTATTIWTAGALAGGVLQGIGAPLQYGWQSFHTTNEGWFGRNTYVGGSDKVSHFILSSGVSRLLYEAYTHIGHSENQSFTLALATTFMTGTMVEVFDGFSVYGFSFQDLTVDALGAAAGLLIQRNHLQDLLGLRIGLVETPIPASAVGASVPTLGRSYNDEIYAADLKLGGLIRRMNGNPGFARFFLTSFVYFTKGFGYDPPLPTRYQEIGFEIGLNFPEILRCFGVSEETWWGTGLIAVFNFFRFPFTQIGVYYNLFDHRWYGPGAPKQYY